MHRLTSGDLACSLSARALSGCDCIDSAVSTDSTCTDERKIVIGAYVWKLCSRADTAKTKTLVLCSKVYRAFIGAEAPHAFTPVMGSCEQAP